MTPEVARIFAPLPRSGKSGWRREGPTRPRALAAVNPAPAIRHGRRAAWQPRSLGSSPAAGGGVRPNQRLKASPQALTCFALASEGFIVHFRSSPTVAHPWLLVTRTKGMSCPRCVSPRHLLSAVSSRERRPFTAGSEVDEHQTYSAQLETITGWPVINGGVRRGAVRRPASTFDFPARRHERGLLRCLAEISDQIGAVGFVRHAVIRHAVERHEPLRVGDEGIHCLRRPDDAAALERR
jgi:hypothetical protein